MRVKPRPTSCSLKVHNASAALATKVSLRLEAMAWVNDARVLDCYCGPTGEMYAAAWSRASQYTGIDHKWIQTDLRRRFVGDTSTVLRHLDLNGFNTFDVDAYGDPWPAMSLLTRKAWSTGERGAFVVTDGSSLKTRMGAISAAQSRLTGLAMFGLEPSQSTAAAVSKLCIQGWAQAAGVKVVTAKHAKGNGSGKGGAVMVYTLLLTLGQ